MSDSPQVGDRAPTFSRRAHDGQTIDSAALDAALVLYFYPRDDSPVCTKQACSFRDELEAFNALSAQVVGVSADSDSRHADFAAKYDLSFPLIADDGELSKAFGVGKALGVLGNRVTFVIDRDGIIRLRYQAQLAARAHVDRALTALREIDVS